MSIRGRTAVSFVGLLLACALFGAEGASSEAAPEVTQQRLVGAWRLVSIECSGPRGPLVDAFYQADSIGLIIYDASGRMSVQIAAPHRHAWTIPTSRSPAGMTDAPLLAAAAFGTYYAYFGTWQYDPATSLVTHHIESSLIPAEVGLSYSQQVAIDGDRMVFTFHEKRRGEDTIHRKVWERVPRDRTGRPQ